MSFSTSTASEKYQNPRNSLLNSTIFLFLSFLLLLPTISHGNNLEIDPVRLDSKLHLQNSTDYTVSEGNVTQTRNRRTIAAGAGIIGTGMFLNLVSLPFLILSFNDCFLKDCDSKYDKPAFALAYSSVSLISTGSVVLLGGLIKRVRIKRGKTKNFTSQKRKRLNAAPSGYSQSNPAMQWNRPRRFH